MQRIKKKCVNQKCHKDFAEDDGTFLYPKSYVSGTLSAVDKEKAEEYYKKIRRKPRVGKDEHC